MARGGWMLTLNPDVLLLPTFVQALVEAGRIDPRVGSVCGKLLAMSASFELPEPPVWIPPGSTSRHVAPPGPGQPEADNGHYLTHEFVFGATRRRPSTGAR